MQPSSTTTTWRRPPDFFNLTTTKANHHVRKEESATMTETEIQDFNSRLTYDRLTGELRWKTSPSNNVKALSIAGGIDGYGYIRLSLAGKTWAAHRLIWTMLMADIPPGMDVDHVNGVRHDNRLSNLRVVTRGENNQNQRTARSNNNHGLLGVSLHKRSGLFNARIKVDGVSQSLGYFKSATEAHAAYLQRKREIHPANTI